MMTTAGGFLVWADIARSGRCRFCHLPIVWRTTSRNKSLPFNGRLAPLHTQVDDQTGARFELLSRDDLHLVTCKRSPGRGQRSRPPRRGEARA